MDNAARGRLGEHLALLFYRACGFTCRDRRWRRGGGEIDLVVQRTGLLVFVEIDLLRTSPDAFRDFRREAKKLPELLECHLVSGNFDYLLKARVRDMQEYRVLLGEKILALPGVSDSRSYVVMEEVKESTVLPVL